MPIPKKNWIKKTHKKQKRLLDYKQRLIELKTYNMEAKMTQLEIAAMAYDMVYYSTQFN